MSRMLKRIAGIPHMRPTPLHPPSSRGPAKRSWDRSLRVPPSIPSTSQSAIGRWSSPTIPGRRSFALPAKRARDADVLAELRISPPALGSVFEKNQRDPAARDQPGDLGHPRQPNSLPALHSGRRRSPISSTCGARVRSDEKFRWPRTQRGPSTPLHTRRPPWPGTSLRGSSCSPLSDRRAIAPGPHRARPTGRR